MQCGNFCILRLTKQLTFQLEWCFTATAVCQAELMEGAVLLHATENALVYYIPNTGVHLTEEL